MTRRAISFLPVIVLAVFVAAQTGGKAPKRYLITDFGAVADAATVNTKAIQSPMVPIETMLRDTGRYPRGRCIPTIRHRLGG